MNLERIYDENSRLTFEDIMLSMIEQEFDKFLAHSYDKNEVDPACISWRKG